MVKRIVAFSGSLREKSMNTSLLKTMAMLGTSLDLQIDIITDINLPFFNEDLEAQGVPESISALYDCVRDCDGIIFATTEYNFLPSALIKNVLDWLSRGGVASPLFQKKIGFVSMGAAEGGQNAQNAMLYAMKRMKWLDMSFITKPMVAFSTREPIDEQKLIQILCQF
jgi:chromate reductase